MFIYAITNDINDKAYVGLHYGADLRTRWTTHRSFAKRGSRSLISMAMRKHGIEKFHITSIWSGYIPVGKLQMLEKYYIRSFQTKVPNGYNLTDGGDGAPGFRHSDSERERRREKMKLQCSTGNIPSLLGKKRDPEIVAKIAASNRGQKRSSPSEETRRRLSLAKIGNKNGLGTKHTQDTINRRRAARAGYRHSEETKSKISASNGIRHWGAKASEETKKKMSLAHKGFRHTEATKRKISETKRMKREK